VFAWLNLITELRTDSFSCNFQYDLTN